MKTKLAHIATSLLRFGSAFMIGASAGVVGAQAQAFDSGSNESLGDVVITNAVSLPMPPDGVFHFKSLTIVDGGNLYFSRNAANSPVYLLATGDITINGQIHVDGARGDSSLGGLAGPGGYNGGHPGFGVIRPGPGFGPGAGRAGLVDNNTESVAGSGGFLYRSGWGPSTNHGQPYGTPVLIPLVGGSGGGGSIQSNGGLGYGGGGGGGALLIASNSKIVFPPANGNSFVSSYGGNRLGGPNGGSGGAIRLVAPKVVGVVRAYVNAEADVASPGRVRIDTVDSSEMSADIRPGVSASRGNFMITGLSTNSPRLSILKVATTTIADGVVEPVSVLLPNGTSPNQTVIVQAKNFHSKVPINVVLTPESGDTTVFPGEIDNTGNGPATATINVVIPVNIPVTLHVWTR